MYLLVLLLFVAKCSAITLEFRHVTQPLSWRNAFASGMCATSHHVKGYVAPENVHADISLSVSDIQEAWVGLHGISTDFLKFDGCLMFEENSLNEEKVSKMSLNEGEDLIGSCYLFCNESQFGISADTCYCLETLRPVSSALCNVNSYTGIWFCTSPNGGVCGGDIIQQTGLRCLCVYRPVDTNRDFDLRVAGDCVSYDVRRSKTTLANCDAPKYFVCSENNIQRNAIFQNLQHSWWNAALMCQSSVHTFGNRPAVVSYIESPNATVVESYWTNKFRKKFYSFLSNENDDYDLCVAVKNESGTFRFYLRDCLHELPALCFSVKPEVTFPEFESTSDSTQVSSNGYDSSVGVTTAGQDEAFGTESKVYAVDTSSVWPVIFVMLGILVIIVMVLLMYRKKRSRKIVETKIVPTQPEPEVVNRPVTNSKDVLPMSTVTKGDNLEITPNENQQYTSLASSRQNIPEHTYMELNENNVSMQTKSIFNQQDSSTQRESMVIRSNTTSPYREDEIMSNDESVYNKLHEKDDKIQPLYDHTGNPDGIYDQIQANDGDTHVPDDVDYDDVTRILK